MEVNKSVKEAKNNDSEGWEKLKHLRLKIAYVMMYQCHNTALWSRHHCCVFTIVMLALQDGSLLYLALPMVLWSLLHETC